MNVNAPAKAVPIVGDDQQIDWSRIDTGFEFSGKKIVLPGEPGEMPFDVAIETLEKIKEAESQVYGTHEVINGLPWDAAVSLFKAMQDIYGVILPQTRHTFFGPKPPSFLSIKTGHREEDVIQVPLGLMQLPGMKSPVNVWIDAQGAHIHGEVNKKDQGRLLEIAIKARKHLRSSSIYRGKAVSLSVDEDSGALIMSNQPEFMDLAHVKESDLIYNELTEAIIRTSIFAPIKHTAECRKHGIPLKRGILLEGRWGCGKSMTARVSAKIAEENGWTFFLIDRAKGLKAALEMARRYEPCIIFAEDLDRFGDRTKEEVNMLVNEMDGLLPATAAVMTIMTTNHIELIDKALLRPGRLDAVISIDPPDPSTVARIIRHYGAALLPADVELSRVGDILAGQTPASIAEIVKRSKLGMLTEGREVLNELDLLTAAESATRHLALLADKQPEPSRGDRLAKLLAEIVAEDNADKLDGLKDVVDEIKEAVS